MLKKSKTNPRYLGKSQGEIVGEIVGKSRGNSRYPGKNEHTSSLLPRIFCDLEDVTICSHVTSRLLQSSCMYLLDTVPHCDYVSHWTGNEGVYIVDGFDYNY